MSLHSYSSPMTELGSDAAGPGPGSSVYANLAQKKHQHQHHHQQHHEHHDPLRAEKVFLSGALSGAISRTATAPVDRLKMLLQTHDDAKGLSLRQGWQKMLAEGSIKSFFKGNGANVVKIAPETALKLTLNDAIRSFLAQDPDHVRVRERMASGGIAGAIAQGLLYPLDTIRTRLAVSKPGTYAGILHAAYRIRRDEGVLAFYRGMMPSMIGILPFAGVDIALFEVFKDQLYERYDGPPPHMGIVVAGMLSSSVAQVVSYPLALVRTRLQAQASHQRAPDGSLVLGELKYRGMMDVFRKTLQHEGVRGLYKGLLPNLLKLAPAAGIGWFVFEETKLALGVDPRS
ncbi:hypothetical protein PLESTB_001252700 [Pleodorina starrii]|uniref:Uncharacterized protein n=1 Tax=Pleodorina starrii TaxID=330485 RepID=A0A9W6BSZ9_9CHLO|nr:hypothetical protein PLESTM_000207200 [Pleodorina starrii]GLC57677.1 hypothetical protein PLESTB_001252700 [Pleodorina starrii]GLC63346.1 hypothetical protein PLESTF_000026500 [Pleodorina starrii]